jgi:hypothetical protein
VRRLALAGAVLLCTSLTSCDRTPGEPTRSGSADARPASADASPAVVDASVRDRAPLDAAAPPVTADPENRSLPPVDDPELVRQGQALLEALAANAPEKADRFFFPQVPFRSLKAVRDPDHYWRYLHGLWAHDLRSVLARRRDWQGATCEGITLPRPTWIAPGKEWNKIGYHRARQARLRYRLGDRTFTIVIDTLISWQGHWYVTHLLPLPARKPR